MMARTPEEKAAAQRKYAEHLQSVGLDRDESYRIQRLCRTSGGQSLGISMDAMDLNKTQLPVCHSQAKTLSKLYRIKQKLTGVEVYGTPGLLLFRTLADVPTGANLTSTILFLWGYWMMPRRCTFSGTGQVTMLPTLTSFSWYGCLCRRSDPGGLYVGCTYYVL